MNQETITADIFTVPMPDSGADQPAGPASEAGELPSLAEWRQRRAAWWRGHVEARRASGESRTAYCRRNDLNPGGLYHWEHKLSGGVDSRRREPAQPANSLRDQDAPGEWRPFPPVGDSTTGAAGGVRFLPLGLLAAGRPDSGLSLFVGGARIEVGASFDPELLRRVVRALAG
jgi:hypothetical protein